MRSIYSSDQNVPTPSKPGVNSNTYMKYEKKEMSSAARTSSDEMTTQQQNHHERGNSRLGSYM